MRKARRRKLTGNTEPDKKCNEHKADKHALKSGGTGAPSTVSKSGSETKNGLSWGRSRVRPATPAIRGVGRCPECLKVGDLDGNGPASEYTAGERAANHRSPKWPRLPS